VPPPFVRSADYFLCFRSEVAIDVVLYLNHTGPFLLWFSKKNGRGAVRVMH